MFRVFCFYFDSNHCGIGYTVEQQDVYIKLKNKRIKNSRRRQVTQKCFEILCFAFSFHIVKLPFDNGANKRGAKFAPDILSERLYPEKNHSINFTNPINYRDLLVTVL